MNIRHEVLDWFELSCGVIVIHLVLMYYVIEIDSSFFRDLSGFFGDFSGVFSILIYALYL
jgi:hypothetical protein